MTRDVPRDLLTLLEAQATAAADAPAIITEDGAVLSRAQVLDRAGAVARDLRAAAGAGAGPAAGPVAGPVAGQGAAPGAAPAAHRPRIGIALPNGSDLALTLLGAMLAGIAVPFNPALGADDAAAALARARVDILVVAPGAEDLAIPSAAARLGIPVLRRSAIAAGKAGEAGEGATERVPRPRPDETAVVLSTSGSTGSGKLVPLSHRNICASAGDVARSMALGPGDRCLSMWEQHHIGGVVDLLLAPLVSGGSVVMTPGFDAGRFADLVSEVRPTWFQGVPATLAELVLQARRRGHRGGGSLRLIRSVAAALTPAGLADLEEVFCVPVIQTFGMTEASPLIASTALPPARRKPGSVGRACGPAIRVLGPDGNDLPHGAEGEVAIRGENVFAGYEDDPAANARAFRDGWFLTGDLGRFDAEGDLFLTGRLKQLINRGGEMVAPDEIDAVLTDHPTIAAAAAFAIPHKGLGEDVAAAVVLRQGGVLSAEDVRTWVAGRLAPFKVPARVVFLDALPRTPVGKVDRPALAALPALAAGLPGSAEGPASGEGPGRVLREPLEAFVAAIWVQELELSAAGPDDDFAELGGDSLSALRVQVALEAAFGLRLTASEARRLRTVRATAAFLRRRGAVLPQSGAADLLGEVAPGSPDAGSDLAAAYAALGRCTRTSEVRARIDAIIVKATPAELAALVSSPPPTAPPTAPATDRATDRATALPERPVGARAHLWLWRARTRLRLACHPGARVWTRRALAPHLDLYQGAGRDPQGRTLIVGFAGNYMRLMLPTWNILVHLDHRAYDLLLLCDPARGHYAAGVPGLGADLPGLAHTLARYADGYARTLALGTSAGGLAAIAVARLNGWAGAVAVGGDRPSAHPGIEAVLRATASAAGRTRLCYGAAQARDTDAAQETAALLGTAVLEPHPGVRQHNLLLHLMRRRRLRSAFDAWFAADPSEASASVASEARAGAADRARA